MRKRRIVQGYTDFGRIRIPPLPPVVVLTDRATGTLYLLSHSNRTETSADGEGHVALVSGFTPPAGERIYLYPAFDEPVLSNNPRTRLIVRNGRLGYAFENSPPPALRDRDQAPLHTRRGLERRTREIVIPTGWAGYPHTLAFTPKEI